MQYSVAVDDPVRTMEKTWMRTPESGMGGVPATFVVDKAGKIAYAGSNPDVLEDVIKQVTNKDYTLEKLASFTKKQEKPVRSFDHEKLYLIGGNGGEDTAFEFRSVLSKDDGSITTGQWQYITGFFYADRQPRYASLKPYQGRVQIISASLKQLYYLAYGDTIWNMVATRDYDGEYADTTAVPERRSSYGKYWREPVLEVSDKTPFNATYTSPVNRYNYSLQVPRSKWGAREKQLVMRGDLQNYFGYEVTVETRMMPCWNITAAPGTAEKLATKTPGQKFRQLEIEEGTHTVHNAVMQDLVCLLELQFGADFRPADLGPEPPFIDMTGIRGELDYSIEEKDLSALKTEGIPAAKRLLNKIGLDLVKSQRPMKVVVIRDPKP